MSKNYRYSFLITAFDNLDEFFKIKNMDYLDEQFGSLNNLIYENCYTIIARYKKVFDFTDNSILDKIMDTLVLGNSIFELKNERDKSKRNDLLVDFISKCSIDDFRIIHNFKLFMVQEISTFHGTKLVKQENYDKKFLEYDKAIAIAICNKLLLLLTALEGGIIYRTLKVKGKLLDLGNELNKLINPKYFSQSVLFDFDVDMFNAIREYLGIDKDVKSKREVVNILSNFYRNFCTKYSSKSFFMFSLYYSKLVDLFNMMYVDEARSVFENYLDLDIFRNNSLDLILNNVEDNILSYIDREDLQDLYKRKYIVPTGGIVLKFEEYNNSLENIISEGYDDVIGYYIFSLQLIYKRSNFSYFNLTGNFNSVAVVNNNLIAMFDFYGVHGRTQDNRERFTIINLIKLANNIIEGGVLSLNCYYADKIDYEVLLPEYWKYRDNVSASRKKTGDTSAPIVSKMIKINAFKRKLAEGQHRSYDAECLAKKLCIKLDDDETIVSPFERKQRIKLSNNF